MLPKKQIKWNQVKRWSQKLTRKEVQAVRSFFRIVSDIGELTMISAYTNIGGGRPLIFVQHQVFPSKLFHDVNLYFRFFTSILPYLHKKNKKVLTIRSATCDGRALYCF